MAEVTKSPVAAAPATGPRTKDDPERPATTALLSGAASTARPQRTKLWSRRAEALRASGTTPRDLMGRDWAYIEGPKATMKNCAFLWMSEIMWEKRPVLPGFGWDTWEKVTPEIIEELGIKVSVKDRTLDGVPKAGMDAFLVWRPKEISKMSDELWLEGANVKGLMKGIRAQYQEETERIVAEVPGWGDGQSGVIGDIEVEEGMLDKTSAAMVEAEERQRAELGGPLR